MDYQRDLAGLSGFEKARRIMWCHELRARVHERLAQTSFIDDPEIVAVHVLNSSDADRVILTAFDRSGRRVGQQSLFFHQRGQYLDIAPEFDHDFTGMSVPAASELSAIVGSITGWVINMAPLRAYDVAEDRAATQRELLLAHLPDLVFAGHVTLTDSAA